MNYEITSYKEIGKTTYRLLETRSKQCIFETDNVFEAQKIKTNLNKGGGFDGWTPPFFLQPKNFFVTKENSLQ